MVFIGVKSALWAKLARSKLHMTLLDPDVGSPQDSARRAKSAARAGTDAIMIGGSTGYTRKDLDATVNAIKRAVKLPVIIFPTSAGLLTGRADAIYFMMMMNSKDVNFLSREQMRGAPLVRKLGLEAISMGYVIIEPGMRVGEVGRAEVVPRNDPKQAAHYALAAQMLGMDCVYLEAGSGAPQPVPAAMVRRVRDTIDIPLIVGGGIRGPRAAAQAARAGADIIVTGTIAEVTQDPYKHLAPIVEAVKGS